MNYEISDGLLSAVVEVVAASDHAEADALLMELEALRGGNDAAEEEGTEAPVETEEAVVADYE